MRLTKNLKKKNRLYLAVAVLFAFLGSMFLLTPTIQAACAAPTTDFGSATTSQAVATSGTYRVWSRIMVPSTTDNSFLLEVDGGTCFTVSTTQVGAWTWVSSGSVSLAAGTHTFKTIGNKVGVKVDRVIMTGDVNCTPDNFKDTATGTVGDNCASPPDTTAPAVSLDSPSPGAVLKTSANISASANDDVGGSGIAKVDFLLDNSVVATQVSAPYAQSLDVSNFSNGTHTLTAKAYDKAGNSSQDSTSVTVQNAVADTQAPTAPTNLAVVANAYNKVTFTWTASSDNVGVTGYYINRGGVTIAQVSSGTTFVDTTVLPSTTHKYSVAAFDAAGNTSGYPATVSVTTPAAPDTQAPTAPTDLSGAYVGTKQINLSWSASADNIGVKEYEIYRSMNSDVAAKIATVASLSYGDLVFSNTTYDYYIVARDASGNSSSASATITRTTPQQLTSTSTGIILSRVTDSSTNNAIAGATATVTVNGVNYAYTTGVNGYFITNGLPAGSYNIKISAPSYSNKTKKTTVSNNTTTSFTVTLRKQ